MNKTIVDLLDENKQKALEFLSESQLSYPSMINFLVNLADLDPTRIVEIDHGEYQGTLVYVVGAKGYQPSDYWYVKVGYGSCSGCDALEDAIYPKDVDKLFKLLHDIASGFRRMNWGEDNV